MSTAFPVGGRDVVERMTQKFPELFVNDDELQRQLTRKINQQFAFTFGPKWGGKKRAGVPDALQSKDSQAVLEPDGTTSVWDMFSSSLAILVNDGDLPVPGTHANLPPSEATFMPAVPYDYLGAGSPPDPPDPPDGELEARVAALEAETAAQAAQIGELQYQNGLQQSQVDALSARVASLEAHALKDTDALAVRWRTTVAGPVSFLRHWHDVDLPVSRA